MKFKIKTEDLSKLEPDIIKKFERLSQLLFIVEKDLKRDLKII